MKAILALEDGTILHGEGFGAVATAVAEVVFNTSMTGYQEVLTDPSYHGQMVVMTASHIGNVGVNAEDVESSRPWVQGFIVREISPLVSNWRATESLPAYLARHGIPGISEIDTRSLTRHLRTAGVLKGALATDGTPAARLVELAQRWAGLDGRDLVKEVTCAHPHTWEEGAAPAWELAQAHAVAVGAPLVVAYDFGSKWNILRRLTSYGCRVVVVPADTPADEVLALAPAGIFLSNGPGDPAAVTYAAAAVRRFLTTDIPLFGICLGHQILGLALGGRTYKLKFGHHGGNQPVKDLVSGRVQITSQNHNYAVAPDSLPPEVEVTHWNLNDGTVEGLRLKDRPVFSVQYHPEASPGPHDADELFARFVTALAH
ncbi:MAG: glutamine-hydrolyzing carbamoyl-phosphate synthase small subunit [Anaerolineae bacterium]|uniref:glutamine-hydrolyzing carbamoyl-phosphate synthase small subunit n=1 Tax=Candidatus Amarolinea dominans TaxID=3140696 RepID=UPI00313642FA|nr:glutamine-hydrolyzing carbamoyl-phosphate synthase small subunit [Anaerolineae bacterium]MBK9094869.1 glutamine-hydrolyzing carbamoyl-phosphate synthase small subunit [Anaerolineae bacterium]MBK9229617.1 glutamine-hydrolyzing carbamoyl-phosphate synthase small subunit [Anaerolineae bacterium]